MVQELVKTRQLNSPRHAIPVCDGEFVKRVKRVAEQHIADPCFTTAHAAAHLVISRMHLNRKMRALTGQTTHQFILTVRLETARTVLLTESPFIRVLARRVGFKSPSHFAKAFRRQFGVLPSHFRMEQGVSPSEQSPRGIAETIAGKPQCSIIATPPE